MVLFIVCARRSTKRYGILLDKKGNFYEQMDKYSNPDVFIVLVGFIGNISNTRCITW